MRIYTDTLISILKDYIRNGALSSTTAFEGWNSDDWDALMKLSTKQGVSAIVYNAIISKIDNEKIPLKIKLNWALLSEKIENRVKTQNTQANEIASIWAKHGIRTVVLKGLGLGGYYPTAWIRECGDFDCFLFEDYQKGIDIALSQGGIFLHDDYKHSQIKYKNIAIEVHKYFTSFRGEVVKHQLENDLQKLIREETPKPIVGGSNILIASSTFNACFLLYHTQFHFLFESVKLRHLLDWVLFVQAEQANINWEYVVSFCKKYKLIKFAEALNAIGQNYFGVELNTPIANHSTYRDRVMNDILNDNEGVSNKSGWSRRFQLLKNTTKTQWKYKLIDSTFVWETAKRAYYFLFSKDKLKTS